MAKKVIDLTDVDFDALIDSLIEMEIEAGLANDPDEDELEELLALEEELVKRQSKRR